MSTRVGYAACWPPAFSWNTPTLYDERGAICHATVDYLEARYGAPPAEPLALVAADDDAALDEILAAVGYERVRD